MYNFLQTHENALRIHKKINKKRVGSQLKVNKIV